MATILRESKKMGLSVQQKPHAVMLIKLLAQCKNSLTHNFSGRY